MAKRCSSSDQQRGVAAAGGVVQGVDRLVLVCPPVGGGGVQLGGPGGSLALQVGESGRCAGVPGCGRCRACCPVAVSSEVWWASRSSRLPASSRPDSCGGQPGRDGVADADHSQELLDVVGQRGEDLPDQVVGDRAVVAGELVEERVAVGGPARARVRPAAARRPSRRCAGAACRPAAGVRCRPDRSSRVAVSAGEKRSRSARSSRSRPVRRSRGSDNGGSNRLDRTSWKPVGRLRSRVCRPCRATGSTSSCTSSRISRIGRGSCCTASVSSARNSGWAPGRHAQGACRRLPGGTDGQAASAATTAVHNRFGSLSSRSRLTQAVSDAGARCAGPVREQHRLAVAGRGADQRDVGTAGGVEVRPQPRPHHQFRRKLRNSDLRLRNQRHRAQPPVWQVRGRRAEPMRIVVAIVASGICSILRPRVLSAWVLVAVEDLGDRGERGSFRGGEPWRAGRRSEEPEPPELVELRRLPAGNDDGRHECPCSGRVGAGGPAATGTAARSRS